LIILPEPMWICCWRSLMKRESSLLNNPVHPLCFALLPLPAHREFWLPQSAASAFLSQSHNGNLCIYVPVPARIHAGIQKQITPFVEKHLFKQPQFLAGQKAKLLFRPVTLSILIIRVIVFHVGHSNGMKKTPEFILDSMGGKGKKGCTVGSVIILDDADDPNLSPLDHFLPVRMIPEFHFRHLLYDVCPVLFQKL